MLLLGFTISALHNQIHLLPAVIFTFSTLNQVKKPWTRAEASANTMHTEHCATNAPVCDVHCMVGCGVQILLNSNKIKNPQT